MSTARPPSRSISAVLAIAVLVAVLALLVAFAVLDTPTDNDTRSATAGLPDLQQELAAHEWLLDAADSSPATRDANPVTLVFGEDAVSGQGPCNPYSGRLSLDDDEDTLTVTDLAQSNRSCDRSTMRAEREYFAALRQVRDVELDDAYNARRLVLDNNTGDRLAFDAIDARELLVDTWHVVNVARDNAIESVVDDTNPLLVFHDDGDVTLVTSCYVISSTYELEGSRLFVDETSKTTRKRCEPGQVRDLEAEFARALETADRVQVIPGQLTILDRDGRIQVIADQESLR